MGQRADTTYGQNPPQIPAPVATIPPADSAEDLTRREAMRAVGKYALLAASTSTVVLTPDEALAQTGLACSRIPSNKRRWTQYCAEGSANPDDWPPWYRNLMRRLGLI